MPCSEIIIEEPLDRLRPSSPSRNPPSNYVHISHLVRPFTLAQLKMLLQRAGELAQVSDEGRDSGEDVTPNFWIDKIKSHCFVQVCTLWNIELN